MPLVSTVMGLQTSYAVRFSFKGLYNLNIKGYIYMCISINIHLYKYIYINMYKGVYNLKNICMSARYC